MTAPNGRSCARPAQRIKSPNPPLTPRALTLWRHACLTTPEPVKQSPSDIGATSKEKNNIVIPEFSAWLTLVLEQCRAENIRNLPRQRAPTPLFPERRPREACSMPISGCHDLPLATFNLPSRNRPQTNAKESPKPKTSSPAPPQGGVPSTLWRHACLAGPPANTCSRNKPSKQTATTPPPQNQKPLVPSLCGGMRV